MLNFQHFFFCHYIYIGFLSKLTPRRRVLQTSPYLQTTALHIHTFWCLSCRLSMLVNLLTGTPTLVNSGTHTTPKRPQPCCNVSKCGSVDDCTARTIKKTRTFVQFQSVWVKKQTFWHIIELQYAKDVQLWSTHQNHCNLCSQMLQVQNGRLGLSAK